MDESEGTTGDEFVLLTDHPMTEEESMSVVESDGDPTPKKKATRNKKDIREAIKARCVTSDQRGGTAEVR
jgi:hypothetical protein